MAEITYKDAGVDVEAGNQAVTRIKGRVESTFSPAVLSDLGGFAALYDLKSVLQAYQHPILVQSIDGVGTKMMVAKMMQKFDTIGMDLVAATTNDIIVIGAKPLTLLDYIANDKLDSNIIDAILQGMSIACREHGISLVGGEMAEMPGTYLPGEVDLAGVITGLVEKDKMILGREIVPGDLVLGLASSGLHTNGYSLARKLLFEAAGHDVHTKLQDFSLSLGEELLIPHRNYTLPISALLEASIPIKGMAHITGGGLSGNIPRMLPKGSGVEIRKQSLPQPPLFALLQKLGSLSDDEMYRTFNMGVGMVLVLAEEHLPKLGQSLKTFPELSCYELGWVVSGSSVVRFL